MFYKKPWTTCLPYICFYSSRYNDIAKYGFFATEIHGADVKVLPSKNEPSTSDGKNHADKSTDIEGYSPRSFQIIASATTLLLPLK